MDKPPAVFVQRVMIGRYFCALRTAVALLLSVLVKYAVRSPKFIWAPCAQQYSLAETPQSPHPSPRIWAHIRRAFGQPR
jgi:hypothetical protein